MVYIKSIDVLVEVASLHNLFLNLNKAIKVTNCKASALENVVKPKLENNIRFMKWELHELEREDFLKLKNI